VHGITTDCTNRMDEVDEVDYGRCGHASLILHPSAFSL
jgi:hypothetical protein